MEAQLKGIVFVDSNENGIKDDGEAAMANAVVSDGYSVVRSDRNGNFKLPGWKKQRFVTLYVGADFTTNKRFIPISPETGRYDFPVLPKKKKEHTSFVHISDTETFEYGNWVDNLKKYVRVHKPDFIVHTGDICYRSGMLWHANNLTEKEVGVPVYYCLGNHDLVKGDYGEQFFEEQFGPAWYAFEEGNALYVITPMMGGDFPPSFDHNDIGGWLQNLLQVYPSNQPKMFFNHDLLTDGDSFVFKKNEKESIILEDYGLKSWFFGHWHINRAKSHGLSGVISYSTATISQGGIDHSPSSFRAVDVDTDGNTATKLRWSFVEKQIHIVSPQNQEAVLNATGKIDFSLNVYDSGAEVDSVRYSVWGEEGFGWETALEKSRWKSMEKASDWNWRATFDPDGQSKFQVVVDAFLHSGEVLHKKADFSVDSRTKIEVSNGEWANLGGNKEHHAVVKGDLSAPYRMEWTANLGSNIYMSSPVFKDNYLLSAGFDDSNASNCFIVCNDASNGQEKWRFKTKNGIKNQMVIAQNTVIATDMLGYTYALDIPSGKLKWQRDLGYNRLPGFITGLVTDGEVVYTGFGESLSALNVTNGQVIWKNTSWTGGEGTTPTMTIADDVLIVSKHWGAIYAHDRLTGALLWSRSDDGLRFRDGVLTYVDGFLWVAERQKLHKIDLRTGETVQELISGMQHTGTSAPIVFHDKVILASSHPGVASFDRETGEKQWQFEVDSPLFYTPSYFSDDQQSVESTPILVGKHLIFGAMDGKVYIIDHTTGRLVWQTKLGAPVITSAAIADQGFYICDFAGNIYYFTSLL
tara:strand:+ start:22904 stop:25324 length:2421 start_codon:yes stop_codon:yes gene_type:complete